MLPDLLIFSIYAFVISGLIFYNGFFRLFEDPTISKKTLALFFLGKIAAVPVFLFVYTKMYGGIEEFDTGKFYHDVKVICDYGKTDPGFLIRLLFGLQDDHKGSADFVNCLQNTVNWDNGTVKDYLYNDNRVVIRTHILLHFPAFGSYPVHALFNCFLSFTGIFFFYKTFKEWFTGKETWMLFILCFFPALWFYTGALLKEGITFFTLGCMLWQLKKLISRQSNLAGIFSLLFLLFISLLLKPYLLLFAAICFALFFSIYRSLAKRKLLLYFSIMALVVLSVNTASVFIKHRSLMEAALKQQHRFVGVSRGGIFLSDTINFIRLTNDTSQLKKIVGKKDCFSIRKNVSYMYWKTTDQKDTLHCYNNTDTLKTYTLVYVIQQSKSNLELPRSNPIVTVAACFYYTLFYPLFFNAKNALQILASFENLLVIATLLILVTGLFMSKKNRFLPLVFLFFTLSLCLLIGLTAPNSGAIFRYRSPAMIFLLLSALYYSEEIKGLFLRGKPRA